jgi:hypothetical protein
MSAPLKPPPSDLHDIMRISVNVTAHFGPS